MIAVFPKTVNETFLFWLVLLKNDNFFEANALFRRVLDRSRSLTFSGVHFTDSNRFKHGLLQISILKECSCGTQKEIGDFLSGPVAKHGFPAFFRKNEQPFVHSVKQFNVFNVGRG